MLKGRRAMRVQLKAAVKPKNGRGSHHLRRDANGASHMPSSHDLTGVLSRSDGSGSVLGDMTMPMLDMTETTMHGFDDGDRYGWNHHPSLSSIPVTLPGPNGDGDLGTHEGFGDSPTLTQHESKGTVDALIGQVMALSTRATRATRQLDRAGSSMPLTVNSPVINEAFEAAHALVRIINRITQANPTSASSQSLPRDENEHEPQPTPDYGLIFLVLASHQHVLALFRVICDSIQRSLGSMVPGSEQQQHALHGDGASSAQFVMVLQLIMHLINRLDRSLRTESQNAAGSGPDAQATGLALFHHHELTPGLEGGEESGGSPCVVDLAQDVLKKLPDEHVKLRQVIQGLQTRMEERLYTW
ncbi:MAG: hypothetical protein M4579_002566 [Chaenotheca gracillima]|nr:MAG: hypothetical protein M4579_002566 [Chaenotheca gracillima]